jgi:hypothetical protein
MQEVGQEMLLQRCCGGGWPASVSACECCLLQHATTPVAASESPLVDPSVKLSSDVGNVVRLHKAALSQAQPCTCFCSSACNGCGCS